MTLRVPLLGMHGTEDPECRNKCDWKYKYKILLVFIYESMRRNRLRHDGAYTTCEYDRSDDMLLYLIHSFFTLSVKNICMLFIFRAIVYSFPPKNFVCVYQKHIFLHFAAARFVCIVPVKMSDLRWQHNKHEYFSGRFWSHLLSSKNISYGALWYLCLACVKLKRVCFCDRLPYEQKDLGCNACATIRDNELWSHKLCRKLDQMVVLTHKLDFNALNLSIKNSRLILGDHLGNLMHKLETDWRVYHWNSDKDRLYSIELVFVLRFCFFLFMSLEYCRSPFQVFYDHHYTTFLFTVDE